MKGAIEGEKCSACHDLTKRKKNIVGPFLWGIIGRPAGGVRRYAYSEPFKKKVEKRLVWTTRNLDLFLKNPKEYIPGTRMLFAGIKDNQRRADLILFLRTLQ